METSPSIEWETTCPSGLGDPSELIGDPDNGRQDLESYVTQKADGTSEMELLVRGAHCGGCLSKIETGIGSLAGVNRARFNLSTARLKVEWSPNRISSREIVTRLSELGYASTPHVENEEQVQRQFEERSILKAMAVAAFAAMNVMILSVAVWSGGEDMSETTRTGFHILSALIALPTVAYSGQVFFRSALANLRQGRANMDVPISLALILACALSLHETVMGYEDTYFDAAVMLLFLLLIGRFLDARLRSRTGDAAHRLAAMQTTSATRIEDDGSLRTLPSQDIVAGDLILVTAGSRFPVDGEIVKGRTDIDAHIATGESQPVSATVGARVYSGSLNLTGPVEVRVLAAHEDSFLSEVRDLVEFGQQSRGRYVRLADKVARAYVPIVHSLALLTFLGWWIIGGEMRPAILNAIAVLIITCPCALGLAVPAVQIVTTGRMFSKGILVKSGDALERLVEIDGIVFDKTGTITNGRPELTNWAEIADDHLSIAKALTSQSRHPYSLALQSLPVPPADGITKVEEVPGRGLSAEYEDQPVRFGSARWLGIDAPTQEGSYSFLQVGDAPPVAFKFSDTVRSDATASVEELKEMGLSVSLLSGDDPAVTQRIAQSVGLDQASGGVLPAQKAEAMALGKTLMVGDGINDAPALANAHASIAMASASDISRASSDMIIQQDRLSLVPEAIRLSRLALRRIRENLGLAILYNLLAIPLAVAGLVNPLIAALAMSGSSLLVTSNALRMLRA